MRYSFSTAIYTIFLAKITIYFIFFFVIIPLRCFLNENESPILWVKLKSEEG
jgi:hypothetical protein